MSGLFCGCQLWFAHIRPIRGGGEVGVSFTQKAALLAMPIRPQVKEAHKGNGQFPRAWQGGQLGLSGFVCWVLVGACSYQADSGGLRWVGDSDLKRPHFTALIWPRGSKTPANLTGRGPGRGTAGGCTLLRYWRFVHTSFW